MEAVPWLSGELSILTHFVGEALSPITGLRDTISLASAIESVKAPAFREVLLIWRALTRSRRTALHRVSCGEEVDSSLSSVDCAVHYNTPPSWPVKGSAVAPISKCLHPNWFEQQWRRVQRQLVFFFSGIINDYRIK